MRRGSRVVVLPSALLVGAWLALAGGPALAEGGPPLCYHGGDVNDDGVVSSGDAQSIFLFALGIQTPSEAEACWGDCNGDGVLSSGDAQAAFLDALGSGSCPYDLPDGEYCFESAECRSGHCQNGLCCTGGDCCLTVDDCPGGYAGDLACDDEATCQGNYREAACEGFVCGSVVYDDDSACHSEILADECGPYPPVYCNGEVEQTVACATSCETDEECDYEVAYCRDGECVPVIIIEGVVNAGGMGLEGALVSVGGQSYESEWGGYFWIQVAPADLLQRPDGPVFLVEVEKSGYAAAYLATSYVPGQMYYWAELTLMPAIHRVGLADNGEDGVYAEFAEGGEALASLEIPLESLPPGVTQVVGKVAYVDPTTADMAAFPGGDFLAQPGASQDLVTLESLGLLHFDLFDQNGDPISDLAGPATLCMQVPAAIEAEAGQTVPLWYYDPATGLWQEDGFGTVEDRGEDGLWMCGEVHHFTWWNYDQPVSTHACFKYVFVWDDTYEPVTETPFYAEGINYYGGAYERPCACDGNDPGPPCPGSRIPSLTVKRSTPGNPEPVRIYTPLDGQNFYLVDDGDGTFSLTTDQAGATLFIAPEQAGSCYAGTGVDTCAFLDGPLGDGILPLSGDINWAPKIYDFQPSEKTVPPDLTVGLYAYIEDWNGDPISPVFATSDCGTVVDESFDDYGGWGYYYATFVAPSELSICRITLTAVDAWGATGTAWTAALVISDMPSGILTGRLVDPSGGDLTGSTARLYGDNWASSDTYDMTLPLGVDGTFNFPDVPCCGLYSDGEWFYLDGFYGTFEFQFDRDGTVWTATENGYYNCCPQSEWNEICPNDFYLPALWGELQGSFHHAEGGIDTSVAELALYQDDAGGGGTDEKDTVVDGLWGTVPVTDGYYSIAAPHGGGRVEASGDSAWYYREYDIYYGGETTVFDLGEGARGTVSGTVFDPGAVGTTLDLYCDYTWEQTVVDENGHYEFVNVQPGWCGVSAQYNGAWNEGVLNANGENLVIDLGGENASLGGTLYDPTGAPVVGADIELYVYNGVASFGQYTQTGPDGAYFFAGLPAGYGDLYAYYYPDGGGGGGGVGKAEGSGGSTYRNVRLPAAGGAYTVDVILEPDWVPTCWENGGGEAVK